MIIVVCLLHNNCVICVPKYQYRPSLIHTNTHTEDKNATMDASIMSFLY